MTFYCISHKCGIIEALRGNEKQKKAERLIKKDLTDEK